MDMSKRRSRRTRSRTGKAINLGPRDMAIFEALARHRYLRSTYLFAFAGGSSETRFKERLGDLFHEGYLDRPEPQWRLPDSRCAPVVYELGSGARQMLADREGETDCATWLGQGVSKQFAHSLMICEVLASIDIAAREQQNLRFVPWTEILAKAPGATRTDSHPFRLSGPNGWVVPDAMFGLEYRSSGRPLFRFFALEVDRATMPIVRSDAAQTSYAKKLLEYRYILQEETYRAALGIPNLIMLTIATSAARLEQIMKHVSEDYDCTRPAFLFRAVPDTIDRNATHAPMPQILTEPWDRAETPLLLTATCA